MARIIWTRVGTVLAAALMLLASAKDCLAQHVATAPASAPASAPAALKDDWLSQIALDELARAGGSGNLASLKETARSACLARLAAGHLDHLQAVNDLYYVFRACEYLEAVRQLPDGEAMAKTLLANRDLARLLYRALDSADAAKSLDRFHDLWKADAKAVEEYPNLAVAFAVASPARSQDPASATIEESFRFYTDKKNSFRYDLKAMPFELSVYLADSRLPLAERDWARGKYLRHSEPAKTYFDVQYDYDSYKDGKPKKIEALDYTLQNLLKVGGVCIDQAYYASHVCKALGIPATVDVGEGASGIGHAWLACLKISPDGKQAAWDLQTARYAAHKYFVGEVRDPVSGKLFPDCELAIIGAAAQLPLQRKEEAETAVRLAEMLTRFSDANSDAGRDALRKLADAYNSRFAKTPAAAVHIDKDIPPLRKLDASLAEDLLAQALDRNLGIRTAWDLLITMRSNNQVPVEHLDRFFDVLVNRTAKDYPDYSSRMILRIVPTITDSQQRLSVYQRMIGIYSRRQDLQGQILIAAGDEFKSQAEAQASQGNKDKAQGCKDKALAAYEQAAAQCMDLAATVMDASDRAERLLLDAGKRDAAIAMYEKLFSGSKKPQDMSATIRSETAWYKLGQRLASLLKDAGKDAQAAAIMKRIDG